MRYYTQGRIAEEYHRRRREENEHTRLCNAGINQKHHVWKSEAEKAEFKKQATDFMCNGGFSEAMRKVRAQYENTSG